jgi:hypothetical protein
MCRFRVHAVFEDKKELAADLSINAASFRGQVWGGQGHPATEVARAV